MDYWRHLADNANLTHYGFIEILSAKEPYYPLMHIQVAISQIITNTPIKDATNFAIIIPLVFSSIFVFLVASKLLDLKTGLLALLIINITDYHIMWGSAPQTTTYGICLFFVFIYAVFQTLAAKDNRKIWFMISTLFIISLILAHAVSSFIALITVMGFMFGVIIYRVVFVKPEPVMPLFILTILNGIFLLQHWFVALYNPIRGTTFFDVITSTLIHYVTEYADFLNRPESVAGYTVFLPPLIERVADTTGITFLIFLSVLGCLFWLSKGFRNRFNFSMIISTVLLMFITFGFPLFGLRNILPSRWFAFMYFFLSIMAACGIIMALSKKSFQENKKAIVFIIIVVLSFFMISNTISNLDSPLWLEESSVSTTYTKQEGVGAETIHRISNTIIIDNRYQELLPKSNSKTNVIIFQDYDQILSSRNSVFMWRNYMIDRPIRILMPIEGYYKRIEFPTIMGVETYNSLDNIHNKIYDNYGLEGYYLI